MTEETPRWLHERLINAERLWLFLDYDGTLADFAPTPEHVEPDPRVLQLLTRLVQHPKIRVAVVSGRRLEHVQRLVPLPKILLAGTYGVELQLPGGDQIDRLEYEAVRPVLDSLKPQWANLIVGREGFFLEDKGWSLALHARFAAENETESVLAEARRSARTVIDRARQGGFRLLGGHKFLELGPTLADKGHTVRDLLARFPWPQAVPLFLGDDDKDEEAFRVVKDHEGIAIVVAAQPRRTEADWRLSSPQAARRWLARLPALVAAEPKTDATG